MNTFYVEIVEHRTNDVAERIDCGTSRSTAEKVERGANINLDHEQYFTRIVEEGVMFVGLRSEG